MRSLKIEKPWLLLQKKDLNFEQGLKLVDDAKKELKELLLMANITYAGDAGFEGWVNMAKKFEDVGADIIELNMCCPNMSYNLELSNCNETSCNIKTGASLGQHEDAVSEIVREIKKAINIPLFVKLTPEGGRIAQVAKALYAAGADSVGGTSNRLGIPLIDLRKTQKSCLSSAGRDKYVMLFWRMVKTSCSERCL